MLYKTAFPHKLLQYLFNLSELTLSPLVWSVNQFTSPYILCTCESHWHLDIIIKRVLYLPLLLVCIAVFGIPAIFGVLLRCLLHLIRRPYVLSKNEFYVPPSINERRLSSTLSLNGHVNRKNSISLLTKGLEKTYTICTANVCLLPELLSRLNNIPDASSRSFTIGERIVVDQFFFQNSIETILNVPHRHRKHSTGSKIDNSKRFKPGHNILTHFPKLDFLCLQETWDRDFSHKLMSELHKVFPWILYDVGKTNLEINRFMLNSGLMFASKYEILDADFLPFNKTVSQCLYSSKGLLMVKVLLSNTEHHDNVGYIFNTHLQAYQGLETALQHQLDEILKWTTNFRQETMKSEDKVLFDVLCGDFNFDNLSPVDVSCTNHELFDVYEDVCRVAPGQDESWTVGTEMRQMCLWEEQVSTPDGLRDALLDPVLRHRHVVDANLQQGTMEEITKTKPQGEDHVMVKLADLAGRRRIDYILFRKENVVNVQNFSFITRLATLTDHIPVSMTFSCQS